MSGERRNFLRLLLATIFWAPWDYPFTFGLTHVAGVGKGRGKGNVGARFNACDNSPLPPPPYSERLTRRLNSCRGGCLECYLFTTLFYYSCTDFPYYVFCAPRVVCSFNSIQIRRVFRLKNLFNKSVEGNNEVCDCLFLLSCTLFT